MGAVMLQGTGSDVGKSVLVAGLCRALSNRGYSVRPFKPQNMSNNAAVTVDGGEIGRAQALQAIAARVAPHTDMNPVLLKPQADRSAQLIVHGKVRGTMGAGNFREARRPLLGEVMESYARLRQQCDIVVVEGAGSPAEINLRTGDIANMGFARAAGVPVVLVGDIDRGGVIAAVVGTRTVIDPADAAMIEGFIINKFRGDPALFEDGYRAIAHLSGWRGFGVVPWLAATARLPSEDAVILERAHKRDRDRVLVACPILPRISNFDDLDPFKLEPGVELVMVPPGRPIPAEAALIVLPGSKATIADLNAIRVEGWDIDIAAHRRRGGMILGLCGGFQMLGRRIADPHGIEGVAGEVAGLGLLDIDTTLSAGKALRQVGGVALGAAFDGYEMHIGETGGADCARPFAMLDNGRPDGAISADGRVLGTYVHGLLSSALLRAALLDRLGTGSSGVDHAHSVDRALDEIASALESCLDIDALIALALRPGEGGPSASAVHDGAEV
jgi:adenosylcobyric acid synthase